MIEKATNKDSFDELIAIALSKPNVYVIAVGPPGCTRVLFFRAMRANLVERYSAFNLSAMDIILGCYQDKLSAYITELLCEKSDVKGIILYASCSEILTGMRFDSLIADVEKKHQITVSVLERGPLAKRKGAPRKNILKILERYDESV